MKSKSVVETTIELALLVSLVMDEVSQVVMEGGVDGSEKVTGTIYANIQYSTASTSSG